MSDTDALIAQLKSGRDIERREAARQLGLSGDKTAIEPLKNALSDTNYSVATAAASALEKLGVHSAVPSALEPTKPTKLGVVSKAIAAASDKIKREQEPKRREQEWIRQSQREQERIIEEQPRLRQERMRQDALRLREARIRQSQLRRQREEAAAQSKSLLGPFMPVGPTKNASAPLCVVL